jgi:hypothetical protein
VSYSAFASYPPGAGRLFDFWVDIPLGNPQKGQTFANSPAVFSQEVRNAGTASGNYGVPNVAFTPNNLTFFRVGLYKGRICVRAPNTNAAAGQLTCNVFPTVGSFQAPTNSITSDGPLAWRFVTVCAQSGAGAQGNPGDNGFRFHTAGQTKVQIQAGGIGAGFGVFWDATGTPKWYSNRDALVGGPTETVVIGTPDEEWHAVELRILSATKQGPATLAVLFDNVQVISRNWGPGTVLPDFTSDVNMNALECVLGNGSLGFPAFFYISEFRVMAGPTLAALF